MPKALTAELVRIWIQNVPTGEFHYKQILNGRIDPAAYDKLRSIMHDLCHEKEPVCEPVGRRDGYYRHIMPLPEAVDWASADTRKGFPVDLPFELRKYVWIYPDTVIVLAGSKSSGKTGFLYQTIKLNLGKDFRIILLTNMEGGVEQMKDRMNAVGILDQSAFTSLPVSENFHDAIREEKTLYLIDYIKAPDDEFYRVGGLISKILDKLKGKGSVAVVAVQKQFGKDVARGGSSTLDSATLYLSLDKNKLKIVDAKAPADPTIDPVNKTWTFIYNKKGTEFVNPVESEELDDIKW